MEKVTQLSYTKVVVVLVLICWDKVCLFSFVINCWFYIHVCVQSEVNFFGNLSHQNLVKLLGYCWNEKELLLVYEFMQNGSLENHLFGSKIFIFIYLLLYGIWDCNNDDVGDAALQPLPWDTRLKILIGAARGLAFLHASDRTAIYGHFKASNILLDPVFCYQL